MSSIPTEAEMTEAVTEEIKPGILALLKLPKCTPAVLIYSVTVLASFALLVTASFLVRLLVALHTSSLPWWAVFFVYAFAGGGLWRASKEFSAWHAGAKNRWGVFTRWAQGLI